MFSCSKKVYVKKSLKNKVKGEFTEAEVAKDEFWEVNSDELNGSFDSDEEEKEIKQAKVKKPKTQVNRRGRKFKHEVDTNIMSIDLSVLQKDADMATGDPIFCKQCNGVFNSFSKLVENDVIMEHQDEDKQEDDVDEAIPDERPEAEDNNNQTWICEFCQAENEVSIEKEEMPTKDTLNYVLEMEEVKHEEAKVKSSSDDNTSLIFCIDTSGSMNGAVYNKEAPKLLFNGRTNARRSQISSKKVSRLDCVRTAINAHIDGMDHVDNQKKVGLVTFDSTVSVIGDGSETPHSITGEMVFDYNGLMENGQKIASTHMNKNITETHIDLVKKVNMLRTKGRTALGPAVLTSIAMAAEGGNGSTVFICTDGLANVGIGSIKQTGRQTKDTNMDTEEFYELLATYANEKGVTVNIVSIEGEECDLETLITLSEKTGGSVNIMNPMKMKENFSAMLQKSAIATNVTVKVLLHKALEFRNEDESNLNKSKTLLRKVVGNATEDSEITFEYKIKDAEDLKEIEDFDIEKLEEIPFQAIIEYTRLDGMKCIRTITKKISTSDDMEEVQKDVNVDILAVNAAQQASKFAKRGEFRAAQAYTINQKRFMKKNARTEADKETYKNWKGNLNIMYDQLHDQNNMEEQAMVVAKAMPKESKMQSKKKKKGFFSKMGDALTSNMYNVSNMNSRKLRK